MGICTQRQRPNHSIEGGNYIGDVKKGDLWYFPAGHPHSLQGIGPGGCEFLLIFDDGNFSEVFYSLIVRLGW